VAEVRTCRFQVQLSHDMRDELEINKPWPFPRHFPTTTLASASAVFHNVAHEIRSARAPTRAGDGSSYPKIVSFLIYNFILILTT
jgi:hypothetical protein